MVIAKSVFRTLLLLCLAQVTHAGVILGEPILGGRLLVEGDGYVTAEFLGSDAGYFNTLYLDTPTTISGPLFSKNSPTGVPPIELGRFDPGTELVFRLDVRNTGDSFFTGDADRNVDGLAHASAITLLDDSLFTTTVGFEDLVGGGDNDFNDFMFRLTNVSDPPPNDINRQQVPEPSMLSLLGISLLGIGLVRGRARSRA
jgi:hypothetical protein